MIGLSYILHNLEKSFRSRLCNSIGIVIAAEARSPSTATRSLQFPMMLINLYLVRR